MDVHNIIGINSQKNFYPTLIVMTDDTFFKNGPYPNFHI